MKRGGPLRRSRIKKRPRKPRGDADDPKYLAFVRTLPCCCPWCVSIPGRFSSPVVAHHLTGAGMARKARDDESMPLTPDHHRALHEFTGPFAGWDRLMRQQWQLAKIADTRKAYARYQENARR